MMRASRLIRFACHGFIIAFSLLSLSFNVQAQSIQLPNGFVNTPLATTLCEPTVLRHDPDGDRLFVAEQCYMQGTTPIVRPIVRIMQNDVLLPGRFLDGIPGFVVEGERGLLGIAFPLKEDWDTHPYVYIYYTRTDGTNYFNRISRFRADTNTAGSEQVVLDLEFLTPNNPLHNGGAMQFGPDGMLYVAVGDNVQAAKAQLLTSVFGKILRLDPLNSDFPSNPSALFPDDNPFFSQTTGNNRGIWALGLRNPYSFAFQPDPTDFTGLANPFRMYISEVGQGRWEEINQGSARANYGWPDTEGDFNQSTFPSYTRPIHVYAHIPVDDCAAIVGSVFYNPEVQMFPNDYVGDYFFMDYCDAWMKRYDVATDTEIPFATNLDYGPVAMELGPNGALYYVTRGFTGDADDGKVHKITFTTDGTPQVNPLPDTVTVAEGETATFSCVASGTAPLSYQWQRADAVTPTNFVNISGAQSATYTTPVTDYDSDHNDKFRCQVSNSLGQTNSTVATLVVIPNQRPTAIITRLSAGDDLDDTYDAGELITFEGAGTDPENETIDSDNMVWRIVLHHNTHTHPFVDSLPGVDEGSFTPPNNSHPDYDVFYRVYLTVTDSFGLSQQVHRDIYPNTVAFILRTEPSGLKISVDDLPAQNTPINSRSIVNMQRTLEAPLTQILNGKIYTFVSWSDGGAADHTITTPNTDVTYTAVYQEISAGVNHEITRTPTLTWVHIPWALGYEIQIEDDPDFDTSDPIYYSKSDVPADAISFTVPAANALPDGTYYWRLRALRSDGTWGTWSTVSTFTVELS
jgi:glucose/arabinose dehydrogenase